MSAVLLYPVKTPWFLLCAAIAMFLVATIYALQRVPNKVVITCCSVMTFALFVSCDHIVSVGFTHELPRGKTIEDLGFLTLLTIVCALVISCLKVHRVTIAFCTGSALLQAGSWLQSVYAYAPGYGWLYACAVVVVGIACGLTYWTNLRVRSASDDVPQDDSQDMTQS